TMSPQFASLQPKLGLMPGSNPPTAPGGWAQVPALVPQSRTPNLNPAQLPDSPLIGIPRSNSAQISNAPGASTQPSATAELQREVRDLRNELQALRDQVRELSQKREK